MRERERERERERFKHERDTRRKIRGRKTSKSRKAMEERREAYEVDLRKTAGNNTDEGMKVKKKVQNKNEAQE